MERFSLELKASVFLENGTGDPRKIDVLTRDVCADGVFIQTYYPFSVGSRVNLEMLLLFGEKTSRVKDCMLRISGVVIRSEEAGIALRFDEEYKVLPSADPVFH